MSWRLTQKREVRDRRTRWYFANLDDYIGRDVEATRGFADGLRIIGLIETVALLA